jgi:hypothetical protein
MASSDICTNDHNYYYYRFDTNIESSSTKDYDATSTGGTDSISMCRLLSQLFNV